MYKYAKGAAVPSKADKSALKADALATKYKSHYDAQTKSKGETNEDLALKDIVSETKATKSYDAYTAATDKVLSDAQAWGTKNLPYKTTTPGGVTDPTNPETDKARQELAKYKGSFASNLYDTLEGKAGGTSWAYQAGPTDTEVKTLSSKEIADKFPLYYDDKSKAFQHMLTKQDDWTAYNDYLKNVATPYANPNVANRKDPKTFNARSVLHTSYKPIMDTNVYNDLLSDWGGSGWKRLSGGGSSAGAALAGAPQGLGARRPEKKGRFHGGYENETYSDENIETESGGNMPPPSLGGSDAWSTMTSTAFAEEIKKLMKENPELAKALVERRAAQKGLYGKYKPGATDDTDMVEASKIQSERKKMTEPEKQMAQRYTDPQSGEVAQVYDNPMDQAKFEKRVSEFRRAMNNVLPQYQTNPPKQRGVLEAVAK